MNESMTLTSPVVVVVVAVVVLLLRLLPRLRIGSTSRQFVSSHCLSLSLSLSFERMNKYYVSCCCCCCCCCSSSAIFFFVSVDTYRRRQRSTITIPSPSIILPALVYSASSISLPPISPSPSTILLLYCTVLYCCYNYSNC